MELMNLMKILKDSGVQRKQAYAAMNETVPAKMIVPVAVNAEKSANDATVTEIVAKKHKPEGRCNSLDSTKVNTISANSSKISVRRRLFSENSRQERGEIMKIYAEVMEKYKNRPKQKPKPKVVVAHAASKLVNNLFINKYYNQYL